MIELDGAGFTKARYAPEATKFHTAAATAISPF
jgi:hypothetical protein